VEICYTSKLSFVIARSSEFNASKIRITRSNLHDGGSIGTKIFAMLFKGDDMFARIFDCLL
jgi:hypothetical protein